MWKKLIKRGEKVELELTKAERKLLLTGLVFLPERVEEAIRTTPPGDPVMLTLGDLEFMAGHVAGEANHAKSERTEEILGDIFEKVEELLDLYAEESGPVKEGSSAPARAITDQVVEEKPTILPIPAKVKKGEELYPVSLTEKQREALISATRLRRGLKNKIKEVPEGTQVVGFTRKELDETASEVDIAIGFAPSPSYRKRLEAIMVKLEDILDALREDEPIRPGGKGAKDDDRIYQLKITLKDVKPPVWRRVLVPDCPLTGLHEVIQVVMGWDDCHLYDFEVGGQRFTDPRGMADLEMGDASRITLGQVAPREKAKFRYTYDFGDDWRHEVLVEKVLPREPGRAYPACIDGKRACPPEDVGGPWGYMEFVEAINDPAHERHDEFMEWRAGFDPERFDPDAVDERLRGILR